MARVLSTRVEGLFSLGSSPCTDFNSDEARRSQALIVPLLAAAVEVFCVGVAGAASVAATGADG
jgi:hypothetical protein